MTLSCCWTPKHLSLTPDMLFTATHLDFTFNLMVHSTPTHKRRRSQ